MRRRHLIVFAVLLALAGLAGPLVILFGSGRGEASFGDAETFGMNELASASVSVEVGERSLPINASAMAPGDRLLGLVVLENDGTLPLRYSLLADDVAGAASLLDALEWTIWRDPSTSCSGSPSSVLYEGRVSDGPLIGDPAVGADTGDRLLNPSQSETLCFVVELPIDTRDVAQGTVAQIDLTVAAEQATEPAS